MSAPTSEASSAAASTPEAAPAPAPESAPALTRITAADVAAIARGAAVFGTGGGGDPLIGSLIAERALRDHGEVPVVAVADLDDDAVVVPIGSIGAPSVSLEKPPAAGELARAIGLYERATGERVTAVMPIEIGGENSMLPIAAAAEARLPIVDGDAMGRAFPEAQMVTFHLAGHGPGTTVLTDAHGNGVVMQPVSGAWSERLARVVCDEMGGAATMIDYVSRGEVVRECAIRGTLSAAHRLGEILGDRGIPDDERVERVRAELDGHRLFRGKVTALERHTRGGFTRGEATLAGIAAYRGAQLVLKFQNEMLLAVRDSAPVASTPDLICVLDDATGRAITTETLAYGARVSVIAAPCDARWRSEAGLATAGPRYFGYDCDYTPVERLITGEVTA